MKLKNLIPEISIVILGLITRLIHLNGSFWLDEAAQALESIRPLSEQLNIRNDFQPPLFHLIVHGFIQLSQSEAWLRLASLIPGLLTIWLVMAIGKRLFSRDVGLTAGILLATSQFHLFYSQELRPYSLATCFALIAFWGWLDLVKAKRRFSPLFFFASLAGLYTMYLFPVFLLSLLILTGIFHRPKFWRTVYYFLLAALVFLPWLPKFMEQTQIGTSLAQVYPVWSNVVSPPLSKMLPLVFVKLILGRIAVDPIPSTIIISLSLLIICLSLMVNTLKKPMGREINLLASLPIILAFLISIWVPVLDPKRVMFCLPFIYLGLAAGLSKSYKSAIVLVILLITNFSAISNYATNPDNQREPWREAITKIEAQAGPEDTVLFAFNAPFAPWAWYQRQNLSTLAITDPKSLPVLSTNRVFVFDYLKTIFDSEDQIDNLLVQQNYVETGHLQYPGIGKIKIYAR